VSFHHRTVPERLVALDVPRPALVRPGRPQLRLGLGRMGPLPAPFATLARIAQDPVHRRDRAQIRARVEQPGPHLGDRQIDMLRLVQHRQHPEDRGCTAPTTARILQTRVRHEMGFGRGRAGVFGRFGAFSGEVAFVQTRNVGTTLARSVVA
jgi:hypothetical protein